MPQIEKFSYQQPETVVASIGGSMVRPKRLNGLFVTGFASFSKNLLDRNITPIAVVGGGGQARMAKEDLLKLGVTDPIEIDNVGIGITQTNVSMVVAKFHEQNIATIRILPHEVKQDEPVFACGKPEQNVVYFLGGMKPKQSTDTVAVQIAKEVCELSVFNISNTKGVHPRLENGKLDYEIIIPYLSWKEYRNLIPPDFSSGMHVPFDPVASRMAEENNMKAILIGGKHPAEIFANFRHCLSGKEFVGTVIQP
jgi:uridylate kinase